MFYCNNCDKEVKEDEMIFDYSDNSFKCKKCNRAVEHTEKR